MSRLHPLVWGLLVGMACGSPTGPGQENDQPPVLAGDIPSGLVAGRMAFMSFARNDDGKILGTHLYTIDWSSPAITLDEI